MKISSTHFKFFRHLFFWCLLPCFKKSLCRFFFFYWYIACMLSCFSHVQLFVNIWTVARQAPLPMGFSRQEYWSGLSCLPPGDLPDPGIKPVPLMAPALAGRIFTISTPWEAPRSIIKIMLTLLKSTKQFSTVFVPFCIPISSV